MSLKINKKTNAGSSGFKVDIVLFLSIKNTSVSSSVPITIGMYREHSGLVTP